MYVGTELFERQGAILLARSDGCSVWQFRSGTGDGTMTVYDVFPGTMLSVTLGLAPFYCMYELICLFVAGTATAAGSSAGAFGRWRHPSDRQQSKRLNPLTYGHLRVFRIFRDRPKNRL